MIVVAVVVAIALALCVAGWVPVVRDALRVDHVLPGPAALTDALTDVVPGDDLVAEPVSA